MGDHRMPRDPLETYALAFRLVRDALVIVALAGLILIATVYWDNARVPVIVPVPAVSPSCAGERC